MRTADHLRRVTWMELFFDLIFVAAISEASKPFANDYSAAGLARFSFLFALIWFAWSGHTLYSTRFDRDDFTQRGLNLLQCFIAAVMAANAKDALDSLASAGFGAAYAGLRLLLSIQYLRSWRLTGGNRLAARFAAGSAAGVVFWIASALSPAPLRYWLWATALTIDLATPWFAERRDQHIPPHAAHFPERFGLFTIIVLGEFVADVMRGIESHEAWSVPAASTAIMGMATAFVLWWWYFDGAQAAEHRPRSAENLRSFQIWQQAHLPLLLGVVTAGIGIKHLIALRDGSHLHHGEAVMLCLSIAAVMLALMAIGWTRGRIRWVGQVAVFIATTALAGIASHLEKPVAALALLSACTGQALLAMRDSPGVKAEDQPAELTEGHRLRA